MAELIQVYQLLDYNKNRKWTTVNFRELILRWWWASLILLQRGHQFTKVLRCLWNMKSLREIAKAIQNTQPPFFMRQKGEGKTWTNNENQVELLTAFMGLVFSHCNILSCMVNNQTNIFFFRVILNKIYYKSKTINWG